MASLDGDTLQAMFDTIVGIMHNKKQISGKQGDYAKKQYEEFLQKIVAVNRNAFLDFNMKVTHLDDFLAFYVCSSSLCKDFWYVAISFFCFVMDKAQWNADSMSINKPWWRILKSWISHL